MVRKYGGKKDGVRAVQSDLPDVPVQILDREIVIHPPHTGAFIYLNNLLGVNNPLQVAGGLIEFLCELVEDTDARWIGRLILDKESGFDVYDVEEILTDLIEDWGERPTTPASGSSPSQATTGKRSTANSRRVGSTRSASTPTDS